MEKAILLDVNGYYAGDYPYQTAADLVGITGAWTLDIPSNGMFKAQYQGGTKTSTGRIAGGKWVDTKPMTPAQQTALDQTNLQRQVVDAVQLYMDAEARTRNYDGILSLCTYATSNNTKFAGEGQAGVDFRDACWMYCYDQLAKAQAGTIPLPTPAGVVGGLPALAWPS